MAVAANKWAVLWAALVFVLAGCGDSSGVLRPVADPHRKPGIGPGGAPARSALPQSSPDQGTK